MLKLRVPLILDPPDEAWFDIGLMHKDIRLARQTGTEQGVPLPAAGMADQMLSQADEAGYTRKDIAAIHDFLARTSAREPHPHLAA